jgi:hypothetical protein
LRSYFFGYKTKKQDDKAADKAATKQKEKDDKAARKQKEKDDKAARKQKEGEQKGKGEDAEDTTQDTQAAGKRKGGAAAAKGDETKPKANRKRKTPASKEEAQPAIESEAGPQREVLMPGNVWARVCCRRQVAARLYDDSKGCQGGAIAACEKQKEILAALPRQRKQKILD